MRASFTDPQGPKRWRALPYLGALLAFVLACSLLDGNAAWVVALTSLAAFNLLGVVPLRQRKARVVELSTKPGVVEIRRAGTRTQKIRARDIVGATTARTREGVLLTFQHGKREQPISLRVETDQDADAIRQALGIGHGGFGSIGWRSIPTDGRRTAVLGRAFAGTLALLCAVLVLCGAEAVAGVLGGVLGIFAAVAMLIGLGELAASPADPSILMTPNGLRLRTVRGWFTLPYDAVLSVEDHGRGLVFKVPPPYDSVGVETSGPSFGGLSAHDRSIAIAQVKSATQRAYGHGPPKRDASERIEVLRRNGESLRDWLMRLDMQGHLLTSSPGYRGNTLDTEDLWTILEDPDGDAELRTAAARVLRHLPNGEARPRIDAAVATVRDDGTSRRLRVAVDDDVDAAAYELAALETVATGRGSRRA